MRSERCCATLAMMDGDAALKAIDAALEDKK